MLTQDKEDNTAGRKTDRKDEAILKWFDYICYTNGSAACQA